MINIANLPGSLRSGNGSASDPFNVATMPIRDVLATVGTGQTVVFGPGVFHFPSDDSGIGWDIPDGVSVVGESRERTVLTFDCAPNPVFLGLRHRGVTTGCSVELSRLTLFMPEAADSTTGLQIFGDAVDISDVAVLNAAGVDFGGVEQGSGLPEGFQIFASNRVPGSNNFRPGATTVCIRQCSVEYRNSGWSQYSTAITCDGAVGGSVSGCTVVGNSHAGFTGSCSIVGCRTVGVNYLYYHDTYTASRVSVRDSLALGCLAFFKTISAGLTSEVTISNNVAFARQAPKATFFVYLMNARHVLVERNQFDAASSFGFLGADIANCVDVRLHENVAAVPEVAMSVQAADTFMHLQDWRSIGNRVRCGNDLGILYSDTI